MARVRVVRRVSIGGRPIPVKRYAPVARTLSGVVYDATATQMRVMAQETRDIILDRLFAARPQPPGGVVVQRPPRAPERADIPVAPRGPFPHAPLARATVLGKRRRGEDGRKLIALGDLARGIVVVPGTTSAGRTWSVKLMRRTHRSSGRSLLYIARVHEFGTRRIPPRPVWRPVARETVARFNAMVRRLGRGKVDAEKLRAALRRLG